LVTAAVLARLAYLAKLKYEVFKSESNINLVSVHSHTGERAVKADLVNGDFYLSVTYNAALLEKIELASKDEPPKDAFLPSIFESFDLFSFDSLLVIVIFLGLIIELIIIYSFFYRIYFSGFKGTLEWLDQQMKRAVNTPVTFMLIIFSSLLFFLIISNTHSIGMVSNNISTVAELSLLNQADLDKIADLLIIISERMNDV
jgi:hypothetical protein